MNDNPAEFSGARRAAALYTEPEDNYSAPAQPAQPVTEQPSSSAPSVVVAEPRGGTSVPLQELVKTSPAAGPGSRVKSPEPRPDSERTSRVRQVLDDDREPAAPASKGWRGFLNRFGFKVSPSSEELKERDHSEVLRACEDVIRQSTWTRTVRILVANRKGNAAKTPLCMGLSGALAIVRGDGVVVTEFSDDKGKLSARAEGTPSLGIGELARDIDQVLTLAQLSGYMVKQTSFASVIGSTRGPREVLTDTDVRAISARLGEFVSIQVMDTGNVYGSPAFRAAVDLADVLVIPTMNAEDSVEDGVELLELLQSQGGHAARLAANALIVRMTDGRPEGRHAKLERRFLDAGVDPESLFDVPFDAHIAKRGPISWGELTQNTRDALTLVGAAVIDTINLAVLPKGNR